MKTRILPILSLLFFLATLVGPVPHAHANSADVKIRLAAAPEFRNVKGKAKYRDRGGERQFQVEVEAARRLSGTVLFVSVDGVLVDQMTITPLGAGRLALNTNRGQAVPIIEDGALVGVTTATGAIVLAGEF